MSKITSYSDEFLEFLYKKYNYDFLIGLENGYITHYNIPKELVIRDLVKGVNIVKVGVGGTLSARGGFLPSYLEYCTGLTVQQFYDIVVLHINDTDARPKCDRVGCNNFIPFSGRLKLGYSHKGHSQYRNYCCSKCSAIGMRQLPNMTDSIKSQIWNRFIPRSQDLSARVREDYSRFINSGEPTDECYFYIATSKDKRFKYGVTQDIELRNRYRHFSNYRLINKGTREFIANLEKTVKLKLGITTEYLNWDLVPKFIRCYLESL